MKKAMFTVEVLISIFILFLVVTLSATSSKFLNQMLKQQERYKNIYAVLFSIQDKISTDICLKNSRITGELSGVEYVAECSLEKESRSFAEEYNEDTGEVTSGHSGSSRFQLYKVNLELLTYNYSIDYYLNQYKKVVQQ